MKDERPQMTRLNWADILDDHILTSIDEQEPTLVVALPLTLVEFIMLPCSPTIH